MPIDFSTLSLPLLGAIFVVAAAVVWVAGTRLTGQVDGIARKTGLGQAFTGMLLLGGITSLPEVATVATASAAGNAPLAINNLLGSAAINLMLLVVADIVYGRDALTSAAARPVTIMQGVLGSMLLVGVALVVVVGEVALFGLGVGVGAVGLAIGCFMALRIAARYEGRHVWEAVGREEAEEGPGRDEDRSLRRLVTATVLLAAIILVAGFCLSSSADAIATQTGISAGLVGFLLVGFATSLPELSSITAAVRAHRYEMAVGDIFGTNLFNIALILLADAVYRGEPVLAEAGRFETVGALLAALLTGVFLIGLLERKNRTVLRMGYDAAIAIPLFAAGMFALSRFAG